MAAPRPSADIVKEFASRPLDFEPRSRYSYSNTGYLLLGHIVERVGARAVRRGPRAAAFEAARPARTRATSRRAAARAWPRATRRSDSARRAGDARRRGLDRRGRRHVVHADRPARVGSRAHGRQGALAGLVRDDEHAAAADRRAHQRLRLRPVDSRSRAGARPPARRRGGRLRRPQRARAVVAFGRRRDGQRRLGGRRARHDRERGAGQADAGGRRPGGGRTAGAGDGA